MLGESRGHLGHEAFATEEDGRVVDSERREAHEWAGVRASTRWSAGVVAPLGTLDRMHDGAQVRRVERRILLQDGSLELLQAA